MNVNTADFWNAVHGTELSCADWRRYPKTFGLITAMVGKDKTVVELGCGMGILAKKLIENKNRYIGIDISIIPKETIEGMGGKFLQADLMDLNIITKDFADYVVATEFLEHFEDVDYIVKESKKFIKKDGAVIFSVPNDCLGHDELEEHYQQFTAKSLHTLLSKYYKTVNVVDYKEYYEGWVHKEDEKTFRNMISLPVLLVIATDRDVL